MSDAPQPFNPFGGIPGFDMAQMMRFLQADGPVHWEVAGQVARWVATGSPDDPEAAPPATVGHAVRERLAEVAGAAEAHVAAATGEPSPGIDILTAPEWAERALVDLRPVLERLATTMRKGMGAAEAGADPMAGMLGAITPLLFGVQGGFIAGQLAQSLLAQHDILLPTSGPPRPALVAPNLEAFANDWSLPPDDLRFYLALGEAVRSRIMARPWLRERILGLACDHVGSFSLDAGSLEAHLGHLDPSDPGAFERLLRDPELVLSAMESDSQQAALARLQEATALLECYGDTMVARIAEPLVPSLGPITEALRRHRVGRSEGDRFIGRLLGLDPGRAAHERAGAFCAGVTERAGPDGLARLLSGAEMTPTRAELEAPGLWLARIDLPQ